MTTSSRNDSAVKSLPIDAIKVGKRHRQDMGDIAGLAASIADVGLLQAVAVRPDLALVAGARRLKAVRQLGWETIPVRVVHDLEDELRLLRAERDENTCRKDPTPEEAVRIKRDIKERLEKEADARKKAGKSADGQAGGRGKKKEEKPSAESAEGFEKAKRPREKVADVVGMSHDTLTKAEVVVAAAEADPDTFGSVKEEMNKTGNVNGAYKKVQKVLSPPPPPEPARYPHSERLHRWLAMVEGETAILLTEGGIGGLLAEPDKWDWDDVTAFILPMLRGTRRILATYEREVRKHATNRGRRVR